MIGCDCAVCASSDPKNKRFRSSLLIQNDRQVVIDTGPDFRMQALAHRLQQVDATVYTHCHTDHIMGFDDLRRFCEITGTSLPVYGSQFTIDALQRIFPYAFDSNLKVSTYVRAQPHIVAANGEFSIGNTGFIPIDVPHGNTPTFGYIILDRGVRKAAYLPDCAALTDSMAGALRDIPLLIIDGLREQPHPTHLHIEAAIAAGRRVGAKITYLTHLTHNVSHQERQKTLPDGVFLAYDGLRLEL
jgi:phosphoribosyl 1,2-cyclic phosphate phosphodiesterase